MNLICKDIPWKFIYLLHLHYLLAAHNSQTVQQVTQPMYLTFEMIKTQQSSCGCLNTSYPKAAEIAKQTGCTRFLITINKQGNTTDIRFVESFP